MSLDPVPDGNDTQPPLSMVASVRPGPDLLNTPPHLPPVFQSPQTTSTTPKSTPPPKPTLAINPYVTQSSSASSGSPYTASPSGRLKLPASAIMRSRSSSLAPLPDVSSPGKMDLASLEIPVFQLKSAPMPTTPSSSSSRDALATHKGAPSLSDIRKRLGSTTKSISESPTAPSNGVNKEQDQNDQSTHSVPPPAPEKTRIVQPTPVLPADSTALKMDKLVDMAEETAPADSLAQQARVLCLQHAWALYFDSKGFVPPPGLAGQPNAGDVHYGEYEKSLLTVGQFDTVEGFARHFNNVKLPSKLSLGSNYHMFKDGIKPMWEDPANANGGKWVVLVRQGQGALLDVAWANLTMALIGEMLDPEDQVCGIVVSIKAKVQRLQVWTRRCDNVDYLNLLGSRIVVAMGLQGRDIDHMSMEYQFHSNNQPPHGVYLHIPFNSTGFRAPAPFTTHTSHTPSRLSNSTSSTNTSSTKDIDAILMPPPPVPAHAGTPMSRSSSHDTSNSRPGSSGSTSGSTSTIAYTSLPVVPRSPGGSAGPLSPSSFNLTSSTGLGRRRLSASSAFAGPMGGKSGGKISPLGSPLLAVRRPSAQVEGR